MTDTIIEDTSKLNPSKLGTREYWDNFYKVETKNFGTNPEDTGENWFDDSDAELKMVQFLQDNLGELECLTESASIVDLGTGNGHLLFELREEDFDGELVGVDYSQVSVDFAKNIAEEKELDVIFQQVDLLTDEEFLASHEFDIILDKGTLDAIALSDTEYDNGKAGVEKYSENVRKLMKDTTLLLITSCNFTEDELCNIIIGEKGDLKKWKKINYPSFEFGGVKGSTICSIGFIKST